MALNIGIIKDISKFKDIRICNFYIKHLVVRMCLKNTNHDPGNVESCIRAINEIILNNIKDERDQQRILNELSAEKHENILPVEAFDWLKEDKRATFWLWGYLHQSDDKDLIQHPWYKNFHNPMSVLYNEAKLSPSPRNHQDRIDLIIHFFDYIHIPPSSGIKKQYMEKLKDKWKIIYEKPEPIKWLPDDEEAVLWAWDSLKKHQKTAPNFDGKKYTTGLTTWFTPLSHAEKLLAIRAALDLWDDNPDSKKLFLLNLNKAWNQKKLRQSRTDKKALNTYLKNETKTRLDTLANHYKMRISDTLEKLINENYHQTFRAEE